MKNPKLFFKLSIISLLLLVVYFTFNLINTPEIMFDIYTKIGHKAYKVKQYDNAIRFYKKAEYQAIDSDEKTLYLLLSYSYLGAIYSEKKDYDIAIQYFSKAISLRDNLKTQHLNYLFRVYNDLANIYVKQEKYILAKEHYRKCLELKSNYYSESYADTLNNLGYLYLRSKEYLNSEKCLKESLIIKEELFGKSSKKLLSTLKNILHLYKLQNNQKKVEIYQKRINNLREE